MKGETARRFGLPGGGGKMGKKTAKRFKVVASLALVVLMLGAVLWGMDRLGLFLHKPAEAAEVDIRALQEDKAGVDPGTAFLLTGRQPLDEKTVRNTLKISPAFSYRLEKRAGGKEYLIVPNQRLAADTVYRMAFDTSGKGREDLSWAFQTRGRFRVVSSLPRERTTHVPLDTGIEVKFSHENYDFSKIHDYFSISPKVEGRFEQHKKTLVFVPSGKLQPSTIYLVTIKKGLPVLGSEETLAEDYTFGFETASGQETGEAFAFEMDAGPYEFAVGDAPVFNVYFYSGYYQKTKTQGQQDLPSLEVAVYRYSDHQAFIRALEERDKIPAWAYQALRNYRQDLSGLRQEARYRTEFLRVNEYNHYVAFPEGLPAGYYVAELTSGGCIRQVWFQVSDLATYSALGEARTLLWVHDLQEKKPVAGARVELANTGITAFTDEGGAALIDWGFAGAGGDGSGSCAYARVSAGSREAVVPLKAGWPFFWAEGYSNYSSARDYWKYLYLERELFKPGDELHFWGVLAYRDSGTRGPEEVVVELKGGGHLYEWAPDTPITSAKVPLKDKTYAGSIQLPALRPGYYYLQVKLGETVIVSRGFSVETYEKPAYRLEIKPEKRAVFAGEGMNFQLQATFFEGTPVPGLNLSYRIGDKSGRVKTNDLGTARIPYIGRAEKEQYGPYNFNWINVTANLPEAGEISAADSVWVFSSKVWLNGKVSRQEDDRVAVDVSLSSVDLSKINAGEYPSEQNFLAGPAAGVLVRGTIFQDIWTKEEAGAYYDFISKKVVKTYDYKHSARRVSDFSLITDASGKASYSGKLDPANSYYIELTAEDDEGRRFKKRLPVPGAVRPETDSYKRYYLAFRGQENGFEVGDKVRLVFKENENELQAREKGFMYFRGRKNIESCEVTGNPWYDFTFTADHVPNVNVYGVYFDGVSYRESEACLVPLARENRSLRIKIAADKEEYRPGEKARLNVVVTDREGRPVRAAVNVNLVDEALYSLSDQHVNLLDALYTDYIYTVLYTRKSHEYPSGPPGGGAEKGGEGEGLRNDFRDTVLFATMYTDEEGKASTEFWLPDNLTSWRVTVQAVTSELLAGSGVIRLPVRLPYFVDLVLNDTYLEGDRPVVLVRSYGGKLAAGVPVYYRMKLVTPDGKELASEGEGASFTAYDWALPPLQAGDYSLTVEGSCGAYSDRVSKRFRVVKSLLERTVARQDLLADGYLPAGLKEQQGPVTLVVSDYEKSQYLRGLCQLAWQDGNRFEQQLAAVEARRLLEQYFPDEKDRMWFGNAEPDSLLRFQQQDGGVAMLPYADSDLDLTALAASCASRYLDSRAMAGYLYQSLENQEAGIDRTAALWGLGALNEPVLLQVNELLNKNGLSAEERINLALASLDLGNGAAGRRTFEQLLEAYGQDLGSTMRINAGRDQDEIIQATAKMAILAARLDHPQKNKLFQYLLENRPSERLNLVEQVLILKYNLQYMEPGPVSFTVEYRGESFTKSLKGLETFSLTVLPEEADTLRFSRVQGKAGVVATLTVPCDPETIKGQQDLAINRSYVVNGRQVEALGRSDLVEVVIDYDIGEKAPEGTYEIVDVLPAGLRYVPRPDMRTDKTSKYLSFPAVVKGQKLTFNVSKGSRRLSYYARVVSPGEYLAEPPLLSNVASGSICAAGSGVRIVIK